MARKNAAFEREFAARHDANHGVTFANGTLGAGSHAAGQDIGAWR